MNAQRPTRPLGPVPGLFNRQSINLIIGTSGSSKTPFLLNQLENYLSGGGFLDYAASPNGPVQMGLIAGAGTQDNILDVLADFSLLDDQSKFPFEVWNGGAIPDHEHETKFDAKADSRSDLDALNRIYDKLNSLLPPAKRPIKLLIIEDFQSLMTSGDTHKIKAVKEFCRNMHEFCQKRDVTIIGTVGTGKAKTYESYPQVADRIPGSHCWGAEMDTLIAIELVDLHKQPESRAEIRRIIVKTRKAPIAVHFGGFQDGRLVVSPSYIPVDAPSPTEAQLDAKLGAVTSGQEMKKRDFLAWAKEMNISDATLERWISKQIDMGTLQREGKANKTVYKKPRPQ